MAYDVGDKIRLRASFVIAGGYVDPTTVTLKVKRIRPLGVEEDFAYPADISKESTGKYFYDYNVQSAGEYLYRFIGTGAAQGAETGRFRVNTDEFA